jgi:hypothetical protein
MIVPSYEYGQFNEFVRFVSTDGQGFCAQWIPAIGKNFPVAPDDPRRGL